LTESSGGLALEIQQKNQALLQRLSKATATIFDQVQFNNVLRSLEQLAFELESSRRKKESQVVADFDAILRKFFKHLSRKIDDLSQSKVGAEARAIKEEATTEALRERLREVTSNDFTPGEKINLKVKIQKLKQALGQRE